MSLSARATDRRGQENMLVLTYRLRNVHTGGTVELCGAFRDLGHFAKFLQVEITRGWQIVGEPQVKP